MQLVAARETAALIKERNESRMDGAKDKGFGIESEKEKIKVSAGGGIDSGFFAATNLAPTTKVQLMKTEYGDGAYSAVLNLVDIVTGTNSYYKLQIVEVPSTSDCYLYRAWGRVGTNIGGSKVEKGRNYDLRRDFKCLYQEKTGNSWDNRNYFEKKAGKFFPVDVDYEVKDDESDAKKSLQDSPKKDSSLPPAVQKVIRMIFDVKVMEDALIEFEIDLKKMPLGKLSKKQINSAYLVLTELSNLIASKSSNRGLLVDATNRFYTLIPHDFGVKSIPVIDSEDVIKEKGDMLDNLLEIEVAYSLLEDEGQGESPLDAHYKKLQCQMSPLDRSDKDFKMVKDFVEKTHCDTHYLNLVVLDVFKIARGNEESRFKKWADSDNRMLLWHGSRITNFAGILSQGLRIAPPEAPRSGYMFGKGIYFADMVTKSANYCCVSSGKEGLMLLAEVALGKQHFLKCSDSSLPETLPKGCNSTKGCGRSHPNESTYITLDNGTVVPVGEQEDSDDSNMHLRYNEYIVYDLSQVQLRYLVKLRFDSSY